MKNAINSLLSLINLKLTRTQSVDAFAKQKMILASIAQDCKTIFDVGANSGSISLKYHQLFPNAKIHCFEPFPDSFKNLEEKALKTDALLANKIAVSNNAGTSTFYVNGKTATNSLLARPKKGKRYYPANAETEHKIEVNTSTLNLYTARQNIEHIDILKLDIQGGELNALKGAEDLLNTDSISIIYTEVMYIAHYDKSPLFHDIASFLAGFGYSLYNTYNNSVAPDGQLRQGDAIFLSPKTREKFESKNLI
jgi:FkbM family methyltransferase